MKFVSIVGSQGSYINFLFTEHNPYEVCVGDQIWSNGQEVDIYEGVDVDVLHDLIGMVDNRHSFISALSRVGVI
jgi:hypothetical protein